MEKVIYIMEALLCIMDIVMTERFVQNNFY